MGEEIKNELDSKKSQSSPQEDYFLQTSRLVRQIAHRKLSHLYRDAIEDITQKVLLKLWKWKKKRDDRELSSEEWQKLANTATQNEIRTFFTNKFHNEVSLNQVVGENEEFYGNLTNDFSNRVEGNTKFETLSLVLFLWKGIKELSSRQKYAILLQRPDLIIQLVACGCCRLQEISDLLELTRDELRQIVQELPFSDEQISLVFERVYHEKLTAKQIWEARCKARVKLAKILKEIQ